MNSKEEARGVRQQLLRGLWVWIKRKTNKLFSRSLFEQKKNHTSEVDLAILHRPSSETSIKTKRLGQPLAVLVAERVTVRGRAPSPLYCTRALLGRGGARRDVVGRAGQGDVLGGISNRGPLEALT